VASKIMYICNQGPEPLICLNWVTCLITGAYCSKVFNPLIIHALS
jgi:hypothetical protein